MSDNVLIKEMIKYDNSYTTISHSISREDFMAAYNEYIKPRRKYKGGWKNRKGSKRR